MREAWRHPGVFLTYFWLLASASAWASPPSEDRGPLDLRLAIAPSQARSDGAWTVLAPKTAARRTAQDAGVPVELVVSARAPDDQSITRLVFVLHPIDATLEDADGATERLTKWDDPSRDSRWTDRTMSLSVDLANRQPGTVIRLPFRLVARGRYAAGVRVQLRAALAAEAPSRSPRVVGRASTLFRVDEVGTLEGPVPSGRILKLQYDRLRSPEGVDLRRSWMVRDEAAGAPSLPFDPELFDAEPSPAADLPSPKATP